jgi:hypothetical protein
MKKYTSLIATGLSLLVLILSISVPEAAALTSATTASAPNVGQALEIAPPLITLTANPGQVIKTTIQLRDITKSNLAVTNEIDDFVAAGEDGTPKILTGDDSNNPFQLKQWISPLPAFTLTPDQIQNLPVTISIPTNASPGGHYGVIRFTGIPPQLKGTGVSLSASIGSLVLLTVNGNLVHKLSVTQFATSQNNKDGKLFQSTPLNFVVKLQNSGNIQEEPEGQILVTDMFGKPVASSSINVPPRNVLPDSTRLFTGVLDHTNLGSKKLFGLYHAKLLVRYGSGYGQTTTAETTFWVIPYKLVALIIILLIAAFFAIRFMLQRYKKRIIKQTQRPVRQQPTKRRRM